MRLVSVLFGAMLAAMLFAQVLTLKPGEYEVVGDVSIPGRPAGSPGQKDTICRTAKDPEDLPKIFGGRGTAQEPCHIVNSKMSGATLTFTSECPTGDRTRETTSGQLTFTSHESYHAAVNIKGGGGRAMTITTTAKRIGECAK